MNSQADGHFVFVFLGYYEEHSYEYLHSGLWMDKSFHFG